MSLSPSGVRIQGDDYQHLFAWYHALRALNPAEDVTGIAVEAEKAGNVDDVVVRHASGRHEHYQVKYSVSASNPIDQAWWTTGATKAGKSPLQRFWASWQLLLRAGPEPHMGLYTNRSLDVRDPVLALRDGSEGRLGPRLRTATPGSKAGRGRSMWAKHVGASEADLLAMLDRLDLRTDQGPSSALLTSTSDRMAAVGLQSHDLAVEHGIAASRSWVTGGSREIDRAMIEAAITHWNLHGGQRRATLVVQGIDHVPWPTSPTVSLDWVDLFDGDHFRERRQLRDPALWNTRLRQELEAAELKIRGLGFDRVMVRGFMRLPAWFATGVAFGNTRGMRLACTQNGEPWGTEVTPGDLQINVPPPVEIGAGPELAVGLSVSNDVLQDVLAYVRNAGLPVKRFVHITVAPAPSGTAIPDAARAMGWATRVRDVVRHQVRETGARKVHLFLSGPAACAMFLGHVWNRVPATQLYEDMNPSYAPAFLIPG